MAIAWPETVNTDAYGMELVPSPNVERIEFESGKGRSYLKNSVAKKTFAFMLTMIDDGVGSEYRTFVSWWDLTLLSGSLSFTFPDLITHTGLTEYEMMGEYSASGQVRKVVQFQVREM
jgi:hypothetical protein